MLTLRGFSDNEVKVPDPSQHLLHLQALTLDCRLFSTLPTAIAQLSSLQRLVVATVTTEDGGWLEPLESLQSLTSLSLTHCDVRFLPNIFESLSMLQQLDLLFCRYLKGLPA